MGPLALVAKQAGYDVSGSDKRDSSYVEHLRKSGIETIHIGQSSEQIAAVHAQRPIDWLVYSSAVSIENPDHPELIFANKHGVKTSKRDELLSQIIQSHNRKLIAVAGTHGKTTTTAMMIWLFKKMGLPVSYSVGAKLSFGEMGQFDVDGEYFVYECDEFDRNFLTFHPDTSLVTGIDWDHHEIYPTRADYQQAFRQFLGQTDRSVLWQSDITQCKLEIHANDIVLEDDAPILNTLSIAGEVNRRNAWQVICAFQALTNAPIEVLVPIMEEFPGLSRRFEKIANGLYTDYAHTIPKIRGCLQMARELSENIVVVYEPLTDRRQHFIKEDYGNLFEGVKKLYWAPSYLAREDPDQAVLSPRELIESMQNKEIAEPVELNEELRKSIQEHLSAGDTVICLSGGGGNSLDEWLRKNF